MHHEYKHTCHLSLPHLWISSIVGDRLRGDVIYRMGFDVGEARKLVRRRILKWAQGWRDRLAQDWANRMTADLSSE